MGLPRRVLPTAPEPTRVPLVVKAFDDIRGVTDDFNWTFGVLPERLDNRDYLHALIGRVVRCTAGKFFDAGSPRPAARPGVTAARAVGMNSSHIVRVTHISGSTVNLVTDVGSSPRRT
jgi:hypothetical protein